MKTTRVTLGLAAVLCFLFLLPARASAGGIFHLSIGGHVTSGVSCNRHHPCHDGRHIIWIGRDHHRWVDYHPRLRPCVSCREVLCQHRAARSSVVLVKERPARRIVEVYSRPVVKIERHQSRRAAYKRLVKKIEVVRR